MRTKPSLLDLLSDDLDMSWVDLAACRGVDPALFFPEDGENASGAKATCRPCPVSAACLDFALATNQDYGIWGGLNRTERARVRKSRAA